MVNFHAISGRLQSSAREKRIISIAHKTLWTWLRYPSRDMSRVQGTLVRHLVMTFGSDVLLLPGIWAAFRNARATCLSGNDRTLTSVNFQPDLLNDFLKDLQRLPLANTDSVEAKLYEQIRTQLESYRENWKQVLSGSTAVAPRPHVMELEAGPSGSSPRSGVSTLSPTTTAAKTLETFIRSLLIFLSSDKVQEDSCESPWQIVVSQDLDFFLPFRQHAPQVLAARDKYAFLDPERAGQPGALGSHICWRALSYRSTWSEKLMDSTGFRDLFFRDYASFKAEIDHLSGSLKLTGRALLLYVCNLNAYGTARHQELKFAEAYFVAEKGWKALLGDRERVEYLEAHKFFTKLHGIGPLIASLITSDLVYSGQVKMPDIAEMGVIIHQISKGAVSGLNSLGLLHSATNKHSVDVIQSAAVNLYNSLHDSFTPDERSQMTFDPIMFEHLLCKYQRVERKVKAFEKELAKNAKKKKAPKRR